MRVGWAPAAALLLILVTNIQSTKVSNDLYLEGEEDASNEFLEVNEKDESFFGSHIRRIRDTFNWDFSPPEDLEDTTDDIDLNESGSGWKNTFNLGNDQKEMTLRVTFTLNEPYHEEYSNRDSTKFQKLSQSISDAVNSLFESLPGTQRTSLVRIQSLVYDVFACKITLDIVTSGYSDTNKIQMILKDNIEKTGKLGEYLVGLKEFNAKVVDSDSHIGCPENTFECDKNKCLPTEALCNGNYDCDDKTDEQNCPEDVNFNGKSQQTKIDDPYYTLPPLIKEDEDTDIDSDADDNCVHFFDCYTGERICYNKTCDGYRDCPNGEDESICQGECPQGYFKCDSTRCIQKTQICNGVQDCYDGTDEKDCNNIDPCKPDDFKCNNGKCIEPSRKCDRINDCSTGEDELNCRCYPDEFTCLSDGRCIERRKVCDRIPHCADGSDERNCDEGYACTPDQWQCDNGNCIKRSKRCDGHFDCPADRSDERNCVVASGFKCRSGKIIPHHLRCNRQYDCPIGDYSDEKNCPCGEGDFRCKNGHCIPSSKRCDITRDCQDGSDEHDCSNADKICMASEFKCLNGQCIKAILQCDQIADCADSTDELNCPCDGYRCRNGACINVVLLCNGVKDCPNGEDEQCENTTPVPCGYDYFRCDANKCIKKDLICNGESDCNDGSDEVNCPVIEHICDPGTFDCGAGECIDQSQVCDRQEDCPNGKDERNCPENTTPVPCGYDYFRCDANKCIKKDLICNGESDCNDGSDEVNCPVIEHICDPGTFDCGAGECIDQSQVCDRQEDCPNGKDERNCPENTTPVPCGYDYFRCDANKCIKKDLICNGESDCNDGSDEVNCPVIEHICDPGTFDCGAGECIDQSQVCDRQEDCPNGKDERNCPDKNCAHECDSRCLDASEICDGVYDCSDHSDEYDCECNGPDDFRCHEGTCINANLKCNNLNDCPDGSDEYNCNNIVPEDKERCLPGQFQCRNGICIQESFKCDNNRDCVDGSDEDDCQTPRFKIPCKKSEFSCTDGRCIPIELRCDNFYDCRDFSDEQQCLNNYACELGKYRCKDGRQCIDEIQYCDGNQDCIDNSDENNCPPSTTTEYNFWHVPYTPAPPTPPTTYGPPPITHAPRISPWDRYPNTNSDGCNSYEWRCENGPCIDNNLRCNGHVDCPYDSSDELDCLPDNRVELNLKIYPGQQVIRNGGDVVFQCRDEGPLRAPVRWIRQGGRPLKPGSTDVKGRLEMFQVTPGDSGVYICQAPGYLGNPKAELMAVLTVETESITIRAPIQVCKYDEATCANGQCIPKSSVCNGIADCSDRSDEDSCHSNGRCEPNQHQCSNGKCILKSWRCDNEDDCGDGSDEQDCGTPIPGQACLPVEYTCRSQQCIPRSYHCDGVSDCLDKSDEVGCVPVHITKPPKPGYIKLSLGDTLVLKCEAVGNPVPLITWRLNWGHVPDTCTSTSENGFGILTCTNMKRSYSGAYSCEAINHKSNSFAVPDAIVEVEDTIPRVCPSGYFNSEARQVSDCIACFCFGKTSRCKSADLFTFNMPTPLGEGGTRLVGVEYNGDIQIGKASVLDDYYYQTHQNVVTVTKLQLRAHNRVKPYISLPESYNGVQLTSYGGLIKYNFMPHSQYQYGRSYPDEAYLPDIIIQGEFGTIYHTKSNDRNVEARLTPEYWTKVSPEGIVPASREDIMMVLDNISIILLKAVHNDAGVNITDFVMQSANHINVGLGAANLVEECLCPPEYTGISCQKCADGYRRESSGPYLGHCVKETPVCPPGTYGDPNSGYACKQCPCPLTNPQNQFATSCALDSYGRIVCDCQTGYMGIKCEQCAPGYAGNPLIPGDSCRQIPQSRCSDIGTLSVRSIDECECKDNVQGRYCDRCKDDAFYLSPDFRHGCALCFCSGVIQTCSSSNLPRKTTTVPFKYPHLLDEIKVYSSLGSTHNAAVETDIKPVLKDGEVTVLSYDIPSTSDIYYWSLPATFAGDKVTSYGGFLTYTLNNVPQSRTWNNAPDVQLISDNRLTFHYYGNFDTKNDRELEATVQFLEKGWQRPDGKEVLRENLLLALADVKTILIKATYTNDGHLASLVKASIDTAEAGGTGPPAFHVEQCDCPRGYIGTSCEDCAPGYTRTDGGLYLKNCAPCECNGHSNMCHPETGKCYNCANNTDGNNCERCKDGYIHDSSYNCIRDYGSGSTGCSDCDRRGLQECQNDYCVCKRNVEGQNCDTCRPGSFGLSAENPEGCLSCYCSGVTRNCYEANEYKRVTIPAPIFGPEYGGYTLMDYNAQNVIRDGFVPVTNESELLYVFNYPPNEELYWSLPVFPGNRVLSYGGKLSLTLRFEVNGGRQYSNQGKDVVLVGQDDSLYWTNQNSLIAGESLSFAVPLTEHGWHLTDSGAHVTREIFMSVLKDLKRVLVRATLADDVYAAAIADVSMEDATNRPHKPGLPDAKGVEICTCEEGYQGTSCETCAPKWYKNYIGNCLPCPCNGFSCSVGPYYDVQCNCLPPHTGEDCSSVIGDDHTYETTTYSPPPHSTVSVRISPKTIEIQEVGSTVNFSCEAYTRNSRRRVHVQWSKMNGELPQGRYYDRDGHLTIYNLQESDSGIYICQASDGVSSSQDMVTLKVPGNEISPPKVTISPSHNYYDEGSEITLQCIATGTPIPTITWQRVSSRALPLNSQSYANYFSIDNAKEEDSGEYRCTATNDAGRAYAIALITVRARIPSSVRERLIVTPAEPTVSEGDTIRITCTGTASMPAGSIAWIRNDGNDFESNVRTSNGVLIVNSAIPENQGVYICRSIIPSVPSVSIVLNVNPSGTTPPNETHDVVVNKDRLSIPTGGTATVDCTPKGFPLPMVKWTKYNADFGPNISQRGETLIITDAQESDEGYYMCEGVVDGISVANVYVYVGIEKLEAPRVEIYPKGEHNVQLDSEFNLQCRVLGGIPEPTVTWSRQGGRTLSSTTQMQPGNILKFERISINDDGEYICTATNNAGDVSARSVIKVRSPPVIVITPSDYITIVQGDPINVECRSDGYPLPDVSIRRADDNRVLATAAPGKASYRMPTSSDRDSGNYICTAKSPAGSTEAQFNIYIERGDGGGFIGGDYGSGDNEIHIDPNDRPQTLTAIEGRDINVGSCGSPSEHNVRWQLADGRPLPSHVVQRGNELFIYNVSKHDSGQYMCVIVNNYGEPLDSKYMYLQVMRPPIITLEPPRQTVSPGQSPIVKCVVDGDDILEIVWTPLNRPLSRRVRIQDSLLIFNQIEVEDAGEYECFARNRLGNATARAEVVVKDWENQPPVSHDNEQHAHVGSTVHLSCVNITTPHKYTIDWTKDNDSLPRSTQVKNDGSLYIRMVTKLDSGRYVCHIRDQYGRTTSNYINLHVEGSACLDYQFPCHNVPRCIDMSFRCDGIDDCEDFSDEAGCFTHEKFSLEPEFMPYRGPRHYNAPLVSIDRRNWQYKVGDNVEVVCRRNPNATRIEWQRLGTNQYVGTTDDGSVLILPNAQEADSGTYRCLGYDSYGSSSYEDFDLEILPDSTGIAYPNNNPNEIVYTGKVGDTVYLSCNHNLPHPVSVEWRREFIPLSPSIRNNEQRLELRHITEDDAGTYICRASNNRDAVENRAVLRVVGIVPQFGSHSWLSLPTIRDAYKQFNIELSFKPTDTQGLILYNSENAGREGDYLAFGLVDGVPQLIIETDRDTGPVIVTGDRPLQLNKWHTARLRRNNGRVTIDIDNVGTFTDESPGILDLKQNLYIGGVPDFEQLPNSLMGIGGFIGCISALKLGGEDKNLMIDSIEKYEIEPCETCTPNMCLNNGVCQEARNERGFTCLCRDGFAGLDCSRTGEACRPGLCGPGKCQDTTDGYKCACPINYTGRRCETQQAIEYPAFRGSAYLAINTPRTTKLFRMSMKIKATSPITDGIIMYCAGSARGEDGFTSLAVHDGRLEFRFDVGDGSGPVVLVSPKPLVPNDWLEVNLRRIGASVEMKINITDVVQGKLPSEKKNLKLETPLFIGGYDDSIVLNENVGVTGGFNGCIKDVTLSQTSIDIISASIQSANVQECAKSERGDVPEDEVECSKCSNGGSCVPGDPTRCICLPDFTGLYCETQVRSPYYRAPVTRSDPCSHSPCRNGGTCINHEQYGRSTYTCDCILGYAGVNCQIGLHLQNSVGFNGNGYIELPGTLLQYDQIGEPALVALAIYTSADGVLVYHKEALAAPGVGEYVLLHIEHGYVVLEWDLGHGPAIISVNHVYVADKDRHQIIAKIHDDQTATLSVDGEVVEGRAPGSAYRMKADSNVYVGGIPESLNTYNLPGFIGCIEQIELMYEGRGVHLGRQAVTGRNTQRCRDSSHS